MSTNDPNAGNNGRAIFPGHTAQNEFQQDVNSLLNTTSITSFLKLLDTELGSLLPGSEQRNILAYVSTKARLFQQWQLWKSDPANHELVDDLRTVYGQWHIDNEHTPALQFNPFTIALVGHARQLTGVQETMLEIQRGLPSPLQA